MVNCVHIFIHTLSINGSLNNVSHASFTILYRRDSKVSFIVTAIVIVIVVMVIVIVVPSYAAK